MKTFSAKRAMSVVLIVFMYALSVFAPSGVLRAEESESATRDEAHLRELRIRIEKLTQEVQRLERLLAEKIFDRFSDVTIERNLAIGMRGNDVRMLQEFLGNHTQFYPEGFVTGYYGVLTNGAVERFKREYGIGEEGFGDETREALNDLFHRRSSFALLASGVTLESTDTPVSQVEGGNDSEDHAIENEALARNIHERINTIRLEHDLSALKWNEGLASVARAHSVDQAGDNEALTDPDLLCQVPTIRHEGFENGFTVRERVENANITFHIVGENIAMIPGLESRTYSYKRGEEEPVCPEERSFSIDSIEEETAYNAHLKEVALALEAVPEVTFLAREYYTEDEIARLAIEGWMNSPGHRENILFPAYSKAGIGIAKINNYYIITQDFIAENR